MVEEILEAAEPAAEKLREYDGKIRLIGQYDADGISATAIAYQMLERLGKDFEYEIVKQLYEEGIERISEEDEELLLFVDIGSGQSEFIQEHIIEGTGKEVIVSDHHEPQIEGDFIHINPHFVGIDGGEAISAAGVTYLLAKQVDEENVDLVQYALVGATGDVQKQDGEFMGLNEQLAEEAVEEGLVDKRKGLDLYGRTTKPIQQSLMYTTDPYLEGVSNNESGAIQLVKSSGVDVRDEGDFRTLADLEPEEEKKLIHKMITQGFPVEQLMNSIYTLQNGYEIDEYSTVINACGRLGKAEKGVHILLEDDQEMAEKISSQYGRKISKSLRFVENNRENDDVIYEQNIGVIDAGSNISDDFIGTVTTISMSNGLFDSPVILGVAEAEKDKLKISTRADKEVVEAGLNLGEIIGEICEELDGEGGGHNIAAGAKIPEENKHKFINQVEEQIADEISEA
ncbi:MAG: single-stranded-DNA-specific exonuclease [Colwellia polaris]|jgi:single-stranded-DNA-specific exonuclease